MPHFRTCFMGVPSRQGAPLDADKAPFEAVLRKLPSPVDFALRHQLPYDVPPLVRVTGLKEGLSLPLRSADADAVLAAYPSGIVPAPRVSFMNPDWPDTIERCVLPYVRRRLGCTVVLKAVFSRFVVDKVGSNSVLAPAQRSPRTFGTLLIALSSQVEGGVVSFTYEDKVHDWTALASSTLTRFTFAATTLAATITTTPVTKGHRVLAVYHLVYANEQMAFLPTPTPMDEAIARLVAAATSPLSPKYNVMGYHLKDGCYANSFDDLDGRDLAFAQALVASNVYDVALALFREPSAQQAVSVVSATLHPTLHLPCLTLQGVDVPAFLYNGDVKSTTFTYRSTGLVFWRKTHRVRLVGIDAAVRTLHERSAHADGTFCGHLTLSSLARAIFELVGPHDFIVWAPFGGPRTFCAALVDGLNALDDASLVNAFWRNHVGVRDEMPLEALAPAMHAALQQFGPEELIDALSVVLLRWGASWAGLSFGYRLLASLAGVSVAPVCPRLDAPFAREYVQHGFASLLQSCVAQKVPKLKQDADEDDDDDEDEEDEANGTYDTMMAIVRDGIPLEHYLWRGPLDGARLQGQLPDALVRTTLEYQLPTLRVEAMAAMYPGFFDPLRTLTPAYAALQHTHDLSLDWLKTSVLAEVPDGSIGFGPPVSSIVAMVRVLDAQKMLTEEMLRRRLYCAWGPYLAAAIAVFLQTTPPNDVGPCVAIFAYLVSLHKILLEINVLLTHYAQLTQTTVSSTDVLGLLILDALDVYEAHAPALLDSFVSHWLDAAANDIAAHRTMVWTVLTKLQQRLPKKVALYRKIATASRRMLAGDAAPLPDFSQRDLVLDCNCHCCAELQEFVLAPRQDRVVLEWTHAQPLCATARDVVVAHPTRLRLSEYETKDVVQGTFTKLDYDANSFAILRALQERDSDASKVRMLTRRLRELDAVP
ncbi:hypothetical protein SDRG_11025 [Saprolegnia diclina VS20]|uniref:Uncharacterized protein n=1 Tax=Saprolegnia diclina (strain VS20) TaxID=1156394 RepID=T0Q9X0_SAPDV|nr:hypothetical protein SDRG_11025 [Saprolegnia diclina VS20]EQC31426.1 hypothetical protein SDRG_11025 [Saprolegnia diclina VS20]|eukprot:XP_008615267.1 hypothetical protein SDRG_11025 [Saprolegnia diclina VS20]